MTRHPGTGQFVGPGDAIASGHPRGAGRVPGAPGEGFVLNQQPQVVTATERVTLAIVPGDHPENARHRGGPGGARPSVTVQHADYRSPANVAMATQLAGPVAGMVGAV